ncbi:MAG TPA: hypothetical protein VLA59_05400 [Patescibacteria group bacterium]|nr:hypothetical protein [Patescibacteria group bacterium]
MSLRRMLPYAAMLVIGQAVLDAGPAIVAEREGGMGLGSALIAALVTQIAGIVLGATLAGYLVDRRSSAAALFAGAYLYYLGLMTTGIAPMGSLGTVVAGMGIAGAGFGAMLTAAFSAAASIAASRSRVSAILLLLAAPIVARTLVGTAFGAGPAALLVGGAAVVGLAVVAARVADPSSRRVATSDGPPDATRMPAGAAALSGLVLAIGTVFAVAGADPSRLSASLLAGSIGMGGFDTIDTVRPVLFAIGLVLLLAGAVPMLARADRTLRVAVPALLLAAISGSGMMAALTQALTAGRLPDLATVLIGAATAIGGLLGLALGGVLLARGRDRRRPAIIGAAALAVVCALGWLTLLGERPEPGAILPVVLIGAGALALGLVASALRLALAEVEPRQLGLAAGAGVVAAVLGSALGGLIGAGEGLATMDGEARGAAMGLIGFVVAAAAALAVAAALPRAPADGPGGTAEDDRLSQSPR